MALLTVIRGGGDLASGVALRLFRAGLQVIILELPEPLVVRRKVSFAEAVFTGKTVVEGIPAALANDLDQAFVLLNRRCIPVLVDPDGQILSEKSFIGRALDPRVLVDARMTKQPPEKSGLSVSMLIGLGPGFVAGENCDAAVETKRGHRLGRVIWNGSCEEDTGIPENVIRSGIDRVLRAPSDGTLIAYAQIGDHLEEGQLIAEINELKVVAPFKGVLRGLLHPGMRVRAGMKIGDVDPRDDPEYCFLVSDKSLAVGGGVMEAIFSSTELRLYIWNGYAPA